MTVITNKIASPPVTKEEKAQVTSVKLNAGCIEKNPAPEAAITLDNLANTLLRRGAAGHTTALFQRELDNLRADVKQRDILLDMRKLTGDNSIQVQDEYVDYLHKVNHENQYISAYLDGLEAGGIITFDERYELSAELYRLTWESDEEHKIEG